MFESLFVARTLATWHGADGSVTVQIANPSSDGVVHPSAPLIICCVKIFFATPFFRLITTPLSNLGNNVWWKPKKCRLTLLQGRPLHALAQDPNKFHYSAGVVHPSAPLIICCVKIFFATPFFRLITTPLLNLGNNVWWKPKKCRLTLIQGRPLHALAHDPNQFHHSAGVVHPSAPLIICCIKIFFATPFVRLITTPLLNLGNNVCWKPKKCRHTLLQGRPLYALAQDRNKFHHSAGVVHPSSPLIISCIKIFFYNTIRQTHNDPSVESW